MCSDFHIILTHPTPYLHRTEPTHADLHSSSSTFQLSNLLDLQSFHFLAFSSDLLCCIKSQRTAQQTKYFVYNISTLPHPIQLVHAFSQYRNPTKTKQAHCTSTNLFLVRNSHRAFKHFTKDEMVDGPV